MWSAGTSDARFRQAVCSSDIAISAAFNTRISGDLAPVAFYSKLLGTTKLRYSMYEEFLAVVLDWEEDQKLPRVAGVRVALWQFGPVLAAAQCKGRGALGRWILRLYPFKFKVQHTKSVDIVVADTLSRMLEGQEADVHVETIWPSCKTCHTCTTS